MKREYEEDEIVTVQTKPNTPSVPRFHSALSIVAETAKQLSWRNVVVGGGFVVALFIYASQWQKPEKPIAKENPYDVRNIPAYSEAPVFNEDLKALSEYDLNLAALLTEEHQRVVITISSWYTAKAIDFAQTPGHYCNGKTILDCLKSFKLNRISELNQLAVNQKSSKSSLDSLLEKSNVQLKVAGLELAEVLATPPQSRRPSQQQVVDTFYPVANAGLPAQQLQPRPLTLAKNLALGQKLEAEIASKSPEEQNVVEFCLSLTEEQRKQTKGCK